MNKRILAVVATIVFAIAGVTALLLHASKAEERAFDGAEMVKVLRVAKGVPVDASTQVVEDAVELVELPAAAVPEGALSSLDDIAGQVTLAPLVPGELLLPAKFGEPGKVAKGEIPEGLQMISVEVVAAPGVAGKLAQGDLSGVIANFAQPDGGRSGFIAEQVQVLDVDKGVDANGAEGATFVVTLAVDGPTAVRISNAASFGTLWLTEQNEQTKTPTRGSVDAKDLLR